MIGAILMKKKDVVKDKNDFTKIIKTGKKISNRSFVIYYKMNHQNHSRYGISVGTKLGNAVFRNKYKRRIRMLITENQVLFRKKKDYIILLRKNAKDLKFQDLKQDFDQLFNKLKEL